MPRLYIFTASFPFGNQETFLEEEIDYLAHQFECIRIIPLGGYRMEMRQYPNNCIIDNSLHCSRHKKVLLGLLFSYKVLPAFLGDFYEHKVYLSINKLKRWVSTFILCSFYLQSPALRYVRKNLQKEDVVYSYWGSDYNIVFPWLKGCAKLVSRFHGNWDLWTSNKEEGYIPLRDKVLDSLTLAVTISKKGELFLSRRHPNTKCITSRLGTRDCGTGIKSQDGIIRIVSCSTVYPIKRVSLIYDSVKELSHSRKVHWTHIGGSIQSSIDYFNELQERVKRNDGDKNLEVSLLGNMSLNDVFAFYESHPVDVFINLSTNEGVPVSIMEAISFNIPIVATDVGATSEIVNDLTGRLVSANPSTTDVAKAIIKVISGGLTPRKYWEQNYCASKNYKDFSILIKHL